MRGYHEPIDEDVIRFSRPEDALRIATFVGGQTEIKRSGEYRVHFTDFLNRPRTLFLGDSVRRIETSAGVGFDRIVNDDEEDG